MPSAPRLPESVTPNEPNALAALTALTAFTTANSLDDLWTHMIAYGAAMETDLLSYHHQAPSFAPDHNNVSVRIHGFPGSWIERYSRRKLHLTDPIMQIFTARIRPMRWSEVDTLVKLTPAQQDYLNRLREWMTGDGIGLPVFGPSGRQGYIGIGRTHRSLDDWGPVETHRLNWIAQSFHVRWCEILLRDMPQDFTLNEKEKRILQSLSLGMQDELICGIVGAQLDSVKRSIKGMMKKMGVSDRPSAILRGIGVGLIKDPATP